MGPLMVKYQPKGWCGFSGTSVTLASLHLSDSSSSQGSNPANNANKSQTASVVVNNSHEGLLPLSSPLLPPTSLPLPSFLPPLSMLPLQADPTSQPLGS
jgi:hypothetical protein